MGFFGDVEGVSGAELHGGGELVGFDACLESVIVWMLVGVELVDLADELESIVVVVGVDVWAFGWMKVGDGLGAVGVDDGALVLGWEE